MPRKSPAAPEPPAPAGRVTPRVNLTLDAETVRRLELVQSEVPDVASQSAAVRYLARTWEERRARKR